MPESSKSSNETKPWVFEPAMLEALSSTGTPRELSPVQKAVEFVTVGLGLTEGQFIPEDSDGYSSRSILLHTPAGPVHYFRVAQGSSSHLGVEYPFSVGVLPGKLIKNALGVERAKLHDDFPYKDAPNRERRLVSVWRFPGADSQNSHIWLQSRIGTIAGDYYDPVLQATTVLDGKLGDVYVPKVRLIALEEGNHTGYVEEEPHEIDEETVYQYEDLFKQLAISVAKRMGGIRQISAETHEISPNRLSYYSPRVQAAQTTAEIIPKLVSKGYAVTEHQTAPQSRLDPLNKILIAQKTRARNQETLALFKEPPTSPNYGRSRGWRMLRGLALHRGIRPTDFDEVLRPLAKVKDIK